MLILSTVS